VSTEARSPRTGREAWPGAWRALVAQTRMELILASRRYENLVVTLVVPLVLLVLFTVVPVTTERPGLRAVDRIVPGVLAVALISTGLVSLGIATAFERSYGVLKRLLGSPLPRWALVTAKTVAVSLTVVLQVVLIASVGGLLGWAPPGGVLGGLAGASPWLVLGTVAFAAAGIWLAGTLRPEVVLAAANGIFVLFVLPGVVVPLDQLPPLVAVPFSVLPPALLAELLRGSLEPGRHVEPLQAAGLAAWAIGLAAAAILSFRAVEE
jgi:ABC-2 type transport system permease protein